MRTRISGGIGVVLCVVSTLSGCSTFSRGAGDVDVAPVPSIGGDFHGWTLVERWIASDFAERITDTQDYALGPEGLVTAETSEFLRYLKEALDVNHIALRGKGALGVPIVHQTVPHRDSMTHVIRVGAIEYRRTYSINQNELQRRGPMRLTYKADAVSNSIDLPE